MRHMREDALFAVGWGGKHYPKALKMYKALKAAEEAGKNAWQGDPDAFEVQMQCCSS